MNPTIETLKDVARFVAAFAALYTAAFFLVALGFSAYLGEWVFK